jgi:glycosyltransferase involved in cell wall biosynthesis
MLPSVSCILPSGYGDRYVETAIDCFYDQDYAGSLELVIVDNNDEPLTWATALPAVKYIRSERTTVADLRNLGTQNAIGEICITWDEDDWSHPDRVAAQVRRLQDSGKAVTGWHNILFYDEADGRTYKYLYEPSGGQHPPYACGTSQCYLKSWWKKHPFRDVNGVEDWPFTQVARDANQLDSCDAEQLCVVRAHSDSKCPPQFGHRQFPAVERSAFPQDFFDAIRREVARNTADGGPKGVTHG